MRIPERIRPALFVIEGAAMVLLAATAFQRLRDSIEYFVFTGDIRFFLAEAFLLGIGWCFGWVVVFHGLAIWRHSIAAKRLAKIYYNKITA